MMLSVCLLTYNQEAVLADALEGILRQRVNFPMEVVIGEDCSTDRTLEVARSYAAKHPNLFRILPTPKNLGDKANLLRTYAECQGKYLTILEGDDFWTHPDKLQRQVDFLESHPDYSICSHFVEMMDETGKIVMRFPRSDRTDYSLRDLCVKNMVQTCAAVYRGKAPLDPWFEQCRNGDWAISVMHALRGPIHIIPEVMARYRVHSAGIWSGLTEIQRLERTLHSFWLMRRHLMNNRRTRLDLGIFLHWGYMILRLIRRGQWGRAAAEMGRMLVNREISWLVWPSAIGGAAVLAAVIWAMAAWLR